MKTRLRAGNIVVTLLALILAAIAMGLGSTLSVGNVGILSRRDETDTTRILKTKRIGGRMNVPRDHSFHLAPANTTLVNGTPTQPNLVDAHSIIC